MNEVPSYEEMQLQLAQAKNNFKMILEFMEVMREQYPAITKQMKTFYDELVFAGFTESQAFEIVKEKGWTLA